MIFLIFIPGLATLDIVVFAGIDLTVSFDRSLPH